MRKPQRVLVVGAGLMGSGIAQVAASAGYRVLLNDVSESAMSAGLARIATSADRLVRRGTVSAEDAATTWGRITPAGDLAAAAASADLVVESVVEDLEVKQELFARLDAWCPPDVLLATNTSQFQIGRIAAACAHPERVIGMHWSNPPILMPLVELVLSPVTSADARAATEAFVLGCHRQLVVCRRDVPGFISNRLSTVLFLEGARLVDEGVASATEVDLVARLMFGHRMGPMETLDLAGLDTALKVSKALHAHYGGDRFAAPPVLGRLVAEGRLGDKSGGGFHERSS